MEEKKRVFISTAIPYVNAKPHIGFVLELVQADVYARFKRSLKADVFFLTGTDENSLKNVQAAEEAGEETAKFVKKNAEFFQKLIHDLNISNDDFIRTSVDERHRKGAEKLWKACSHDIYKKKYKGFYCLGCEEFKTEKDLDEKGRCPEHPNKEIEIVEEENYFFKLSNYQEKIKEAIEAGKIQIIPEKRKNEMLSFIKSGLEDFSISRSKERAKGWGIPVPGDENQVMYVWFDALTNYITALDYANNGEKFKEFWEEGEVVHIIGKGINRFHTIYWPAMLLSSGEKMPNKVFAHGYVTADGQKMSKSLGNVVDPFSLIEKYGAEAVRYYLLREIPAYEDGDFSKEKFEMRYNGDLANGLGNFASRVLKLYAEFGGEETEALVDLEKVEEIKEKINEFKFNEAISSIFEMITRGDKYFNEKKPWETKDKTIIGDAVGLLKKVSELLIPFLPEAAGKILEKVKNKEAIKEPLFPRLEKKNV